VVISACVFAVLAWAIVSGGAAQGASAASLAPISDIGHAMMSRYILPLEVVGLLLTAALIGAVVIAMEEKRRTK
jgi:NADH-quinone oxidoreductase subunit J